jgi:putative heme iron utilization protein
MADHLAALRALLRSEKQALLSTLSIRHGGHPFGSFVPFALDPSGAPLLYLSGLAVHTQNLLADGRSSLLVSDSTSSELQPARATLVGSCAQLAGAQADAAREAFALRHPESQALALPGFSPFRLEVLEVRWVGGFAAAAWIDGGKLRGS